VSVYTEVEWELRLERLGSQLEALCFMAQGDPNADVIIKRYALQELIKEIECLQSSMKQSSALASPL
jgi:hypothetical protein